MTFFKDITFFKDMKTGSTGNVTFLGVVSGLTDISSGMLYPITPIFLTSVLGAPMSVTGFIEGVAGYSLSAVSKPVCALASTLALALRTQKKQLAF